MAKRVAIVGAGPGGYAAAVRAAQLGADVTVVERDNVGGTCLNSGCIPSKVMATAAGMLDNFRRAHEFGLEVSGEVRPDMSRMMERKERVVQDQQKGILDLLARNRVTILRGTATITGPGKAVAAIHGSEPLEMGWDSLILATGSRPLDFPAFPFDGERILSSSDALNLREIPRSIMILGGGVIGCEFAFILAMLGSEVTLVEALDRVLPLPSVDADCSKVLQREMKKRKIKFYLNRTVTAVDRDGTGLRVALAPSASGGASGPGPVQVEKLLVCVGRKPNSESLGIENLGLQPDGKGWITADERMETGVPGVFAIGDVLGPSRIMLAHVASAEGLIAAENALGGDRRMSYDVVPGAIFTNPEVACVGLTEEQARGSGLCARSETVLFRNLGKAQVIGEIAGEAKIVSDAQTGRVLGVHMIGPHATDLIAEGALAVRMGATVRDLAETIHAHPTLPEIMLEASLKSLGA
ncbi:MAG: dihydrolipoyl dehydrogenase [Desulfobacteraceae bacterium]|nr:dihydrolipoyl dehydrogenase [Desulfobacteraceae bacterium]